MNHPRLTKTLSILGILFCSGLLFGSLCGCFLIFGPVEYLRDLWITTAMDTFHHQYLAKWFFTPDYIEVVLERNKPVVNDEDFDPDLIHIEKKEDTPSSETESEPSVTETEPSSAPVSESETESESESETESEPLSIEDVITVEDISRNGDTGYFVGSMMIIKDPTLVRVGISKNFGDTGEKLIDMCTRLGAWAGLNGAGFSDAEGKGNGGYAEGVVMKDGEIIWNSSPGTTHDVIGIDYNGVLVLQRMTDEELASSNLRDCVEFGPFLIVNGKSTKVGVTGLHPRSAIGQRADGAFLFLAIDGRSASSIGATQTDIIKIMEEYGAVNCANLDGGSSSTLVYNNEIINKPSSASKTGRYLPTAFVVMDPAMLQGEE